MVGHPTTATDVTLGLSCPFELVAMQPAMAMATRMSSAFGIFGCAL